LRGIDGVGDEWQAVLSNNVRFDVFELRVEVRDQGSAVSDQVHASVKERFPDFWKNLQMGLYELRVTPCAPASLRTGSKLKRIVDERVLTSSK